MTEIDRIWPLVIDGREAVYCDGCNMVLYVPESGTTNRRKYWGYNCPICGHGKVWYLTGGSFNPQLLADSSRRKTENIFHV